jgi:hypothetical protein
MVMLQRRAAVSEQAVSYRFSGKRFTAEEISLIREVVVTCGGLSRMELANTISELLGWTRPGGGLKGLECLAVLQRLETQHLLRLPQKQKTKPEGSVTSIPRTARGEPGPPLVGQVEVFAPVVLDRVQRVEQRQLFRELIGRYHPVGYAVPFGAHVQYLISVSKPAPAVVGCLQFSSAAWRMRARDEWIGWDDATRERHLPRVVNNSRFLLVPWARIQNLASAALALALRRLPGDWQARYGVAPLLVETLVNPAHYSGGCYRAANWVELGQTSGRGRDDRDHRRHGVSPKRVWVYPLTRDAVERLRGGD